VINPLKLTIAIRVHCTAIKRPVPDRVQPSFLIFGHIDMQLWASECLDVKNYVWRLNPVWHEDVL